jgi:UDP-N-acetylmuramoyl-L-alanyl-D-glutamate--2,6-diaminopimelate ligase
VSMGAKVEQHADRVVLTDDNPRTEDPQQIVAEILTGMKQPAAVHVEHDRGRAIAWAMQHAVSGDVVLVAGKGHETVQIIGTRALPFSDRERVLQLARDRAR